MSRYTKNARVIKRVTNVSFAKLLSAISENLFGTIYKLHECVDYFQLQRTQDPKVTLLV